MAHIETTLLHAGREHNPTPSITPPVWLTSTYRSPEDMDVYSEMAAAVKAPHFYHRHGSPLNNQVCSILAALEGTEDALLTASGMGAVSTTLLALIEAGDHIITQHSIYSSVNLFFREVLTRYGVEVTWVDQADNQAFEDEIRDNTRLIYIETPSNPNLVLTDLEFIGRLGKEKGILTVCDNTFCSPVNQQPARWGIDVVVHSATKYLGGHSDLTAGAVCGPQDIIRQVWKNLIMLGASLGAMDAWLLLRGLRTLSLRVGQINSNALSLARFLETRKEIREVLYSGLSAHPQHSLAVRQMSGHSGMICIRMAGETPAEEFVRAQTVISRLKLFSNAASLGGVESLVVHPASLWSNHHPEGQMQKSGVTSGTLRLSVGLENIQDLIQDFENALGRIQDNE